MKSQALQNHSVIIWDEDEVLGVKTRNEDESQNIDTGLNKIF